MASRVVSIVHLGRAADDGTRLSQVVDAAQGRMAQVIRDGYAEAFDREGPGWASLSAPYLAAKLRDGFAPRILVRTGELRESYTNAEHPDHVDERGGETVVVGSAHRLAAIHQNGYVALRLRLVPSKPRRRRRGYKAAGRAAGNGLPARPVRIGSPTDRRLRAEVERMLLEMARAALSD